MFLGEIWRYPVKSMKGEQLSLARIGQQGIEGDRSVRVEDARRHTVTSRSRPRLLGLRGTTGERGEVLVNGRRWADPAVAEDVSSAIGSNARLILEPGHGFDILPLLVATERDCGARRGWAAIAAEPGHRRSGRTLRARLGR